MKYSSLDNQEFKELIMLKKNSFIGYTTVSIILILIIYSIIDKILPSTIDINASLIVFLLTSGFLIFMVYNNQKYLSELIKREKRIYRGVLSSKSPKVRHGKTYFVLKMDGNSFFVKEETYNQCNIGDIVEFHTSPYTKYLFRAEKIEDAC